MPETFEQELGDVLEAFRSGTANAHDVVAVFLAFRNQERAEITKEIERGDLFVERAMRANIELVR